LKGSHGSDDQERPNINESMTGASGITNVAQKRSDPICNSYECPLKRSLGREYLRFYDHEDTFHRQEEAPVKVEHVHPMDKVNL